MSYLLCRRPPSSALSYVIPQVFIYKGEEGRSYLNLASEFSGVQPAVPFLISFFLGLGISGSVVVGTSALIVGN